MWLILITVKIYYYEVFRKGLIKLILEDDATVKDALNKLIQEFSVEFMKKTGRTLEKSFETLFNVFVNGKHITIPSDNGYQLEDGDTLVILRPVRGG